MESKFSRIERGQSLVLIGLLMIAFVAMLALVVDGGFSYANRRAAQNAADAGALAGATVYCETGNAGDAYDTAISYAKDNNHATDADADVEGLSVVVTASVQYQTFFASMLGFDVVTATADASAGCKQGCEANHVLPVAWSCNEPITGTVGISGTMDIEDCLVPLGPSSPYIIMDSDKLEGDVNCGELGEPGVPFTPTVGLDCDLNDDGINEFLGAGQRSWLNLDGEEGNADELKDWLADGYDQPLKTHTWRPAVEGNITSAYLAITSDMIGDTFLIPVFDQWCLDDPEAICPSMWHYDENDETFFGTSHYYFHIIAFSPFVITCVAATPSDHCPGKELFLTKNNITGGDAQSLKTVEGYFVDKYDPNVSGNCGVWTGIGAYTLYLDD